MAFFSDNGSSLAFLSRVELGFPSHAPRHTASAHSNVCFQINRGTLQRTKAENGFNAQTFIDLTGSKTGESCPSLQIDDYFIVPVQICAGLQRKLQATVYAGPWA